MKTPLIPRTPPFLHTAQGCAQRTDPAPTEEKHGKRGAPYETPLKGTAFRPS
ncbi:hypothetical protein WCP94_003804 [Bilophila wadsworthia]